ncbi:hypothetical protein ACIBUY_34080 [Streptomyces sp. NPDC050085]|uniref:hypothetical protein n=1 Tax=Streptomyces sp. NPDC050085 TaxID=3365600 RepID=UPI0037B2A62D
MPAQLPTAVDFQLPEGWSPASPETCDSFGVSFAALHPHPDDGFTANITLDGEVPARDTPLTDLADTSLELLAQTAESVHVVDRREVGPADAPALVQRVVLEAAVEHERRDLAQTQVYLPLVDTDDPHKYAVIKLALTSTTEQHHEVLEDFQAFVRTVRPSAQEEN